VKTPSTACTPKEKVPPRGEVTWYWRRNDSPLSFDCFVSSTIVAMAASIVVKNTEPTENDAGTRARTRWAGVPSSKLKVTRDCCGVAGSASASRYTPGLTSVRGANLPDCASGPMRPETSAWKSLDANGTSEW